MTQKTRHIESAAEAVSRDPQGLMALPAEFLRALQTVRQRGALALSIAGRDLRTRYSGQMAGSLWIVGHPLLQTLLLVFIFGYVFKQRIGGTHDLPRDYTTYILAGLVPWLSISPVITGAASAVVNSASLVKQFQFEPDVLPMKDVLQSLIFWVVGNLIIVAYLLLREHALPWTYVLLPVVLVMHLGFALGLAWLLAAVGVFLRDLKDVAVVAAQIGIYILPIVYLPAWVPPTFAPLITWNPLSAMIWVYQDTVYFGRIEHPGAWPAFLALSITMFTVGHYAFRRLRPYFGAAL